YKDQKAVQVDLAKASDDELVQYQLDKNDWYVRHARRLMQERQDGEKVGEKLREMLAKNSDSTRRLRALWALNASGALTPDDLKQAEKDQDPYVRAWGITLAIDPTAPLNLTGPFASSPSPSGRGQGEGELPGDDPSPVTRLSIASALQRTPIENRWP